MEKTYKIEQITEAAIREYALQHLVPFIGTANQVALYRKEIWPGKFNRWQCAGVGTREECVAKLWALGHSEAR